MRTGRLRVAIDLGAGSGRALAGRVGADGVHLEEVHRFRYGPRPREGHLRWDFASLLAGVEEGPARGEGRVRARSGVVSVGVDSWAVDYGLLDDDGRLLEEPIAYRDERTQGVMEKVFALVPREEIFARTGIQFLALNTLYPALRARARGTAPARARLLLIPDLCHHHLFGAVHGEPTNASTTQLVDARAGRWDDELFARLDLPRDSCPTSCPRARPGRLRPERQAALGVGALRSRARDP